MKIQSENGYKHFYITNKRTFNSEGIISEENVLSSLNFAYAMSFGNEGEHRSYRSGGNVRRNQLQIFIDTFHGKLAEFAVYEKMQREGIPTTPVDIETYGLGKWDSVDFRIKGYNTAIKSTKHFGNLLLLETKDWEMNGIYIPTPDIPVDFIILIRIKPFLEANKIELPTDEKSIYEVLYNIIMNITFEYDFAGIIGVKRVNEIIQNNQIILQNDYLNSATIMDADNYYCESGDMGSIHEFINHLETLIEK